MVGDDQKDVRDEGKNGCEMLSQKSGIDRKLGFDSEISHAYIPRPRRS
jgi:hypothetical protein